MRLAWEGERAGKCQAGWRRKTWRRFGEKGRYPGRQQKRESWRVGAAALGSPVGALGQGLLTPLCLPQIKVEEDFGFEADEALDSSWVSRGPDKLLPYPTLASPPFD